MKRKIIGSIIILSIALLIFGCNNNLKHSYGITEEEAKVIEENYEKNKVADLEKELADLSKIKENKYMVLVNKDNKLDSSYEPDDLVKSNIEFLSHIETRHLDKATSEAATELFNAAKKEGITLLGASGYRAYNIQEVIYSSKVKDVGEIKAGEYLAPPGASEHQTGYALDIVSDTYGILDEGFENTQAFDWLKENCYKYGFILRYPKEKEDITKYNYEPWHYRYIGDIKAAEEIMKSELSLEEYIEELDKEIVDIYNELNLK